MHNNAKERCAHSDGLVDLVQGTEHPKGAHDPALLSSLLNGLDLLQLRSSYTQKGCLQRERAAQFPQQPQLIVRKE